MDNQYHNKLNEYISNMTNMMYTFEVTKCCGYSAFISIYTNESTLDLYSKISNHFGDAEIISLFFYSFNGDRIRVPLSNMKMSQFVKQNTMCNPAKLTPIYALPNPVIYRLYLDDGHCSTGYCTSVYCVNATNNYV
jgi:hypothetical protein